MPLRPLPYREVKRKLEAAGFAEVGQKGSRVKSARETDEGIRTAIVPRHREVAVGTLRSVLRQRGLARKGSSAYKIPSSCRSALAARLLPWRRHERTRDRGIPNSPEGKAEMFVVGVNGCSGGWIAAIRDTTRSSLCFEVHGTFGKLLASYPDAVCVAVDIPIGLAQGGTRLCDVEARRVLGPRRSSVFPPPDPRLLDYLAQNDFATTYEQANDTSRRISGKGISRQAFAIYPKIAEVNGAMTPELQERVIEVHPEVSFWALAGQRPMEHPKKNPEGFEERRNHLSGAGEGFRIPPRRDAGRVALRAKADDVLDATVAAWTARRFAEGRSGRLPTGPSIDVDARGLRMEMVY